MNKKLVIFDVDNTLLKGYTQRLFIKFLYEKGEVSSVYYVLLSLWFVLYKIGAIRNPKHAMEYGFSFIKNKKDADVEDILNSFLTSVLVPRIYPGVVEIIKKHREEEGIIILVSNSPDIIIGKIAGYLHVESFISTKLEKVNDVYTGKINGVIMYGEEKLNAINLFLKSRSLSLENSWFYSDHESDVFLLNKVSHPIIVNPTKRLMIIAMKNNWPVLNFKL
jgi:HAD superfamily hydrolase (TIGR01490 family)